jgi:NADPH dehydrogenase (quinone)
MKTILLILGTDNGPNSKGQFNRGLFDTARETLSPNHDILTTIIENGFTPEDEAEKFRQADAVIFQYPIFWFMVPAALKAYLDQVYQRRVFYGRVTPYGTGGRMQGNFMLSTTWNAPPEAFNDKTTFFEGRSVDEANAPMRKAQHYIGLKDLPHFSCHNVIAEPDFEGDRARYIAHLNAVFPSP